MDYIVGAGLLFGAVLTIGLGRMLLKHPGAPADQEAFGRAEAIAFVFTVLLAGGVSLVAARALDESSLESLIQMTVALATAGAASVVAWVALGRVSRRRERARAALPAGSPDAPRRGRPDRPSGTGITAGRQRKRKRAA